MLDHLRSVRDLKGRTPTVPPGLVPRPALAERLTVAAGLPVTLVCAGPGAGKTLTVASWVASGAAPGPVGWFSVDSSDNDLLLFWSNLVWAVIRSGGVPANSSLRDLAFTSEFGTDQLLTVVDRLAELPVTVVLVVDDLHEVGAAAVLETFGYLVDHLPPSLRLVLLSRADPVLRVHRLRVAGQLTEIRAADLAFTEPETAQLFRSAGLQLDAAQVATLRNRTEGWPAGLRLAAMSLDPSDVGAGIDRFSGTDRAVADYLVAEMTRLLPATDRDFLLAVSVVDRVTGPLADQLTGRTDGQQVLEGFVQANAFIVGLGGGREWFRFHPLLLELVRHRLALERPDWKPELHRRAAAWFTDQADLIEATGQWISAGDHRRAGRTLVAAMPKLLTVQGPALAAAVAPLAAIAPHAPSLTALLAAATCHYDRRDYQAMLRDVDDATHYLDQADPDVRADTEVVLGLLRMTGHRAAGDATGVTVIAPRIVDLVESTPRQLLPAGRIYQAIVRGNLGSAHVWTGETELAKELLERVAAEAGDLGLLLTGVSAHGHLAVLEAMRGELRAAGRRTGHLLATADLHGWGSEPQVLPALLAQALLDLARQRLSSADALLRRGLAASRGQTDRAVRLALGITSTLVAVSQLDAAAAVTAERRVAVGLTRTPAVPSVLRRWAAVAGAEVHLLNGQPAQAVARIGSPQTTPGFTESWGRVCLARAHLALNDPAAAESVLTPLLQPFPTQYLEPAVAAWLLHAVLTTRRRRDATAMSAVTTALDLARPEDIRRPVLMIGPALTPVLARYQNLGQRHRDFVAQLLEPMTHGSAVPDEKTLVGHLTERELAVLQYLPTMLKAGEIAADLSVSVNTIKAHMRSIYHKLGVGNRREAVDRARTLRLL